MGYAGEGQTQFRGKNQVPEGSIASLRSMNLDDEFWMFEFKVIPCAKSYSHKWTLCPCAHAGETARRRDPRSGKYKAILCPFVKAKKNCPLGDACGHSHNVFEHWLHPLRYKTRLCSFGRNCNRPICFFAHTAEELRPSPPEIDDNPAQEHEYLAHMMAQQNDGMNSLAFNNNAMYGYAPQTMSNPIHRAMSMPVNRGMDGALHFAPMTAPYLMQSGLIPNMRQDYFMGDGTGMAVTSPPMTGMPKKQNGNVDVILSMVNSGVLPKVKVPSPPSPTSTLSHGRYGNDCTPVQTRGPSETGELNQSPDASLSPAPFLSALAAQLQDQGINPSEEQVAACLSQLLAQLLIKT